MNKGLIKELRGICVDHGQSYSEYVIHCLDTGKRFLNKQVLMDWLGY